jgi:hypothetical protein
MSKESGTDGHGLANILERGIEIAQQFPDHTISEIEASHIYDPSLRMVIAPYAIRPDITRVFLLCAMDGKKLVGTPDDSKFMLHNLRLSNNVTFPNGMYGQVGEPAISDRLPAYNEEAWPFPANKAADTRRVGEALANMRINASSLKVSYPLPETGQYPVAADVMGNFTSNRARYNFDDTVVNRLTVMSEVEDTPNEHGVTITRYECLTHDGTIPVNFTMYQNGPKP